MQQWCEATSAAKYFISLAVYYSKPILSLRNLFFAIFAVLALAACKKSSTQPAAAFNSGKYIAYREADTFYSIKNNTYVPSQVNITTASADTSYTFNAGSSPTVQISAGTPIFSGDTLVFTSPTNGYYTGNGVIFFLYDESTHIMNAGNKGEALIYPAGDNIVNRYSRNQLYSSSTFYKRF